MTKKLTKCGQPLEGEIVRLNKKKSYFGIDWGDPVGDNSAHFTIKNDGSVIIHHTVPAWERNENDT